MITEPSFGQTGPPGQNVFHPAVFSRTESMAQTFLDTFPQAGWIDPITRRHTAFKNLTPSDQRQALANMGFSRESPTTLAKNALFRAFAKECQACLEQKINGRPALTKAQTRLRQRLTMMAQTMDIHPRAADIEPHEWHYN